MDYRTADAGRIAAVLTLQAGIVAGLVFLTLHLLLTTHYYATALLLVGVAVMVALGMTQVIGRVISGTKRGHSEPAEDPLGGQLGRGQSSIGLLPDARGAAFGSAGQVLH